MAKSQACGITTERPPSTTEAGYVLPVKYTYAHYSISSMTDMDGEDVNHLPGGGAFESSKYILNRVRLQGYEGSSSREEATGAIYKQKNPKQQKLGLIVYQRFVLLHPCTNNSPSA